MNERLLVIPVVGLAWIVFLQSAIAVPRQSKCFADVCIDPDTIQLKVSKFPAAPNYPIRVFKGTRRFDEQRSPAVMEVDCRANQFRTVQIYEKGRWEKFDPRWTMIVSANHNNLFKVRTYVCTRSHA